jgi:NitT/TauT family transport system substrate-binding protein
MSANRNSVQSILFVGMMLIFVSGIVASCAPASQSLVREKVKVGIIPIVDLAQLYVARDKGYFTDAGLDIELVNMAGGAVIAPAVESGELNIGFSNCVSIAAAKEQGFDFVFVAPGSFSRRATSQPDVGSIMVPYNSSIKSAADLDGKVIAVNTRGNISELIVLAWAGNEGIAPGSIRFSEVPYPQMGTVLSTNKIDGALVWEPFVTQSLSDKSARILNARPVTVMADQIMIAGWFAKQSWVNQNPSTAKAFVLAIKHANEYINSNVAETRAIVGRAIGVDEKTAQAMTLPQFPQNWSKADLQVVLDFSTRYGLLAKPLDASQIVAESAGAN